MRYEDIKVGSVYKVTRKINSGHFYPVGTMVRVLNKHDSEVNGQTIYVQSLSHSFPQDLFPEELGEI